MTNLTRYDPFGLTRLDPFESLTREFMPSTLRSVWRSLGEPVMPIEVEERDQAFLLTAEMPGVKKEDIDISISGSQVTINAEARHEAMASDAKEWCNERSYGKFSRTIQLPLEIEEKGAEAAYADGVLRLTLPKKASSVATKLVIH